MVCHGGAEAGGSGMQMWRTLAVVACVVLGLSGSARAGWLDDATAAYARGDYLTAVNIVKPHAELGDARAQYYLGFMYRDGQGVAQDYKTAVKWFTLAAERGFASAQNNLGWMYRNGEGVAQDDKAAVKWYTLAAEQGDATAQSNLSWMYRNGKGVAQDYKAAVKWNTLAAEQGYATAQSNLGVMYAKGQGVAQDYVKAHMWFNIAAIDGSDKKAAPNRDAIAEKMTPAQIAQAQELASKCIAQKFRNCGL